MAYKDYPYAAKASHRHISGPDLVKYTTYGADLLDGGGLVNNLARQGTTLSALRKLKHKNKLTEKQELTIEKKEKRLVGLQKLYALESQKLARGHEDHKKLDTVSDEFAYLTRRVDNIERELEEKRKAEKELIKIREKAEKELIKIQEKEKAAEAEGEPIKKLHDIIKSLKSKKAIPETSESLEVLRDKLRDLRVTKKDIKLVEDEESKKDGLAELYAETNKMTREAYEKPHVVRSKYGRR